VRELRNVIRAALAMCGDARQIDAAHLPLLAEEAAAGAAMATFPSASLRLD
jgi:hypothetical protein